MSAGKRNLAARVLFSGKQSFIGPEMNREPFRKVDYDEWKGGLGSDIKLRKKN